MPIVPEPPRPQPARARRIGHPAERRFAVQAPNTRQVLTDNYHGVLERTWDSLVQVYTWCRTPCPGWARQLGLLHEVIALASRAERCAQYWVEHEYACKVAQLHSVERLTTQLAAQQLTPRHAWVIGSGLLREIPLPELAHTFEQVYLVDVIHLPQVRQQAAHYANVHCVTADITGILEPLSRLGRISESAELAPLFSRPVPWPLADLPSPASPRDWLVSCNLLSQLALPPIGWLHRKRPDLDETLLERWGRAIMYQHLQWLRQLPVERCLITDYRYQVQDARGNMQETIDLESVLHPTEGADEVLPRWQWSLAPPGELPDELHSTHDVLACCWRGSNQPSPL